MRKIGVGDKLDWMIPRISSLIALTRLEGMLSNISSISIPFRSPSTICLPDLPKMSERIEES